MTDEAYPIPTEGGLLVPCGPRQVNELRRVCLPTKVVRDLGFGPGSWATVSRVRTDPYALLIEPTAQPEDDLGGRDSARPRRIGPTGQIALPSRLMTEVGLEVNSLIYFFPSNVESGIRQVSSLRVRAVAVRTKL